MLILKVKLKANINLALRIAKKHRHAIACIESHPRLKLRVFFFCTYKTYLYAQNEISYEYIQILF